MAFDINRFYLISLAICFVHSFFFIVFLKPFEYFGLKEQTVFNYAFGYAFVNLTNEFIVIALFSKVFVKFSNPWNLWKDSLFWLILLFTVTVSMLLAIHVSDDIPFTLAHFFKMYGLIIVVGFIPFCVFVTTKLIISRKNHIEKFTKINKNIKYKLMVHHFNTKYNDTEFHIVGLNKKDLFKFKEKDFYYATSEENYVHIFFEYDNQIEKLTFRISLISFIRQLSSTENIIQCHKSYVVNKSKIVNIGGSTRGYKLYLKNIENPIPIGLKFYEEIANKITLSKN
jgi:hypothetical protein